MECLLTTGYFQTVYCVHMVSLTFSFPDIFSDAGVHILGVPPTGMYSFVTSKWHAFLPFFFIFVQICFVQFFVLFKLRSSFSLPFFAGRHSSYFLTKLLIRFLDTAHLLLQLRCAGYKQLLSTYQATVTCKISDK